jgi:hypothetical protein
MIFIFKNPKKFLNNTRLLLSLLSSKNQIDLQLLFGHNGNRYNIGVDPNLPIIPNNIQWNRIEEYLLRQLRLIEKGEGDPATTVLVDVTEIGTHRA